MASLTYTMHDESIRTTSVNRMCDVTTNILNVFSFTFVFFVKQIFVFVLLFLLIQFSIQANVIVILPKFLPTYN